MLLSLITGWMLHTSPLVWQQLVSDTVNLNWRGHLSQEESRMKTGTISISPGLIAGVEECPTTRQRIGRYKCQMGLSKVPSSCIPMKMSTEQRHPLNTAKPFPK